MLLTSGCYTSFSPQWTRREIKRQTGAAPRDSFEFHLDGATMNLAGLTRIDLAVFAQGENQPLYGRQKGRLARDLPSTLQSILRTAGLAGLKEHLLSATHDSQPPPSP